MKKSFFWIILISLTLFLVNCAKEEKMKETSANPFFTEWTTPFGTPPFDQIKEEHYKPAFLEGMKRQKEEIQSIINNPEPPTFANTIEALEYSGSLLTKVENVFENLLSAHTNDTLQAIAKETAPLLSQHYDDIYLNTKLLKE